MTGIFLFTIMSRLTSECPIQWTLVAFTGVKVDGAWSWTV